MNNEYNYYILSSCSKWLSLVILALRRLRQKDQPRSKASLGYIVSFRIAWTTEQNQQDWRHGSVI